MNFNENYLWRDKTKLLNLRFSKLHSIVQRFYINWSLTLKTKSCWHCIPKMCRKEISSSNIAKAKKILFLNCVSNSVVELNICTAIKKNIQIIKNLGPHIYMHYLHLRVNEPDSHQAKVHNKWLNWICRHHQPPFETFLTYKEINWRKHTQIMNRLELLLGWMKNVIIPT